MSKFKIVRSSKVPAKELTYPFHELEVDAAFFVPEEEHTIESVRMAASRAGSTPDAVRRKIRYSVRRTDKGCWVLCEKRTHSATRRGRPRRDTVETIIDSSLFQE